MSSFIGLLTRLFCRERLDDTKVMVLVVSSSKVTAQLGLLCLKITINTVCPLILLDYLGNRFHTDLHTCVWVKFASAREIGNSDRSYFVT